MGKKKRIICSNVRCIVMLSLFIGKTGQISHKVRLDRSLTFHHHRLTLRKELSLHVTLLRQLASSEWDLVAKSPHTSDYLSCTQQPDTAIQFDVAPHILALLTLS